MKTINEFIRTLFYFTLLTICIVATAIVWSKASLENEIKIEVLDNQSKYDSLVYVNKIKDQIILDQISKLNECKNKIDSLKKVVKKERDFVHYSIYPKQKKEIKKLFDVIKDNQNEIHMRDSLLSYMAEVFNQK